jgi:hypothetical protein
MTTNNEAERVESYPVITLPNRQKFFRRHNHE